MTTEYESMWSVQAADLLPSPWSEALAQRIAVEGGLGELTETHWKVIHTLREHFVQYGAMPPMQLACGVNQLAPDCVDTLFHGADRAWHVAGLPEPGSEGLGYL